MSRLVPMEIDAMGGTTTLGKQWPNDWSFNDKGGIGYVVS